MITFFFSPLYDAILLVGCFALVRKFILKKNLSANERFFFQHTSSFIYIPFAIIQVVLICYAIGINRGLFYEDLYSLHYIYSFLIFLWMILLCIAMVNRVRYGPKDREFVERTKTGTSIKMGLIILDIMNGLNVKLEMTLII